jgi:hypothetical protein
MGRELQHLHFPLNVQRVIKSRIMKSDMYHAWGEIKNAYIILTGNLERGRR